jgi:hypothetical protein
MSDPRSIRRWFQYVFWLAPLTAFATIALCVYGGFSKLESHHLRKMAQERAANAESMFLAEINAVETKHSAGIEFYDMDGADEMLSRLKPLPYLYLVTFHQAPVSATGLKHLVTQPNLKAICFNTVGVENKEIEAVAALPHLESLVLRQTSLGDTGIRLASAIPTLRQLKLSYGRSLVPCPMTDAAIDNLADCTQLRELTLEGEWFSHDAVSRLRKALPECEIIVVRFEKEVQGSSIGP